MRKFLNRIGILAAITLLAISVTACSSPSTGGQSSSKEATSTANDTIEVYGIGDTVEYKGLELKVLSAELVEDTDEPELEHDKVLTIEVEITNNTGEKSFTDAGEFALYDTNGRSMQYYSKFGYDSLDGAAINDGKKAIGKLHYDVPIDTEYELIYTPVFLFDGEHDMKINIKMD